MAKVYIKTNSNNCVVDINSDEFLSDTANWIQIDEGIGDKYSYAQGNYFSKPLTEEHGVFLYKRVSGVVSERTTDEIQADINAIPVSEPTESQRLSTTEDTVEVLLTQILPMLA
jgi:hypothetical protein